MVYVPADSGTEPAAVWSGVAASLNFFLSTPWISRLWLSLPSFSSATLTVPALAVYAFWSKLYLPPASSDLTVRSMAPVVPWVTVPPPLPLQSPRRSLRRGRA